MDRTSRILILTAPIGQGHQMAAAAVAQALARAGAQVETKDLFDFLPAWLSAAILKSYQGLLRYFPEGYQAMYRWGNGGSTSLKWRQRLIDLLAARLQKYLQQVQPDAVVVTHAAPAGVAACCKQRFHQKFYLAGVLTDFVVHKWWYDPQVDTYFVPTEKAAAQLRLLAAGQNAKSHRPGTGQKTHLPNILVTGIPIRRHFSHMTYLHAREQFHWRPGDLAVLLLGGGEGLLPMEEIITALDKEYIPGLRIVAVAGHNQDLAAALEKFPQVTVYGFTEQLPDLLIGADLVVTKAGGLTLAEALASGTEIVIYRPLPGAEQGNAAYFQQQHWSRQAGSPREVVQFIRRYRELPEADRALRLQNKVQAARPEAAQEIAAAVLEEI